MKELKSEQLYVIITNNDDNAGDTKLFKDANEAQKEFDEIEDMEEDGYERGAWLGIITLGVGFGFSTSSGTPEEDPFYGLEVIDSKLPPQ